jgi:hypothetical protein
LCSRIERGVISVGWQPDFPQNRWRKSLSGISQKGIPFSGSKKKFALAVAIVESEKGRMAR